MVIIIIIKFKKDEKKDEYEYMQKIIHNSSNPSQFANLLHYY